MRAFSRITELFALLAPYHRHVARENSQHGYPAQRPLFFHYPDDANVRDIQFQYMYGKGKQTLFFKIYSYISFHGMNFGDQQNYNVF